MKFEIGSTLLSVDNLSAFRRVLFYLLVPIFFFFYFAFSFYFVYILAYQTAAWLALCYVETLIID